VTQVPWDAALITRIAHLHLLARNAVDGWRHGEHRSRKTAANIEFKDYQEYSPGDPLKHLDWKVAARSDRLVIRRQEDETEVSVTLVLDCSGDLGTGSDEAPELEGSKLGTAIVMTATLAVFLEHHGDPVGLEILGGEGVKHRSIPPRTGSLARIIRTLAEVRPGGEARLATAFESIGGRLARRSVVILLSDLMEEPNEWGPQVGAMVRRGIDLRVAHLHDPAEWTLRHSSPAQLFSPEGGVELPIDPSIARGPLAEVVAEYLLEVKQWLGRYRGRHHLVPWDASLDKVLAAMVGDQPWS
jgi:uncharacterized protein (DUF58 family)